MRADVMASIGSEETTSVIPSRGRRAPRLEGQVQTVPAAPKKTPAQGWRSVIEAGFIQARNLSSSDLNIREAGRRVQVKVLDYP